MPNEILYSIEVDVKAENFLTGEIARSLCKERYRNWRWRFVPGQVHETGDDPVPDFGERKRNRHGCFLPFMET